MPNKAESPKFRETFAETLRHLCGLGGWLLLSALALGIEAWAIVAHYLSTQNSFELLGYEQKPLGLDPMFGPLLDGFLGESNLSHFLAGVLVIIIALVSFLFANLLFRIFDLLEHRKAYQQERAALANMPGEATADFDRAVQVIHYKILQNAALLLLLSVGFFFCIHWDIYLNIYLALAGAYDIHQASQAPGTIQIPANEMKDNGHLFAWKLAMVGSQGLLAAMMLAAMSLELCFRRTSERFGKLCNVTGEITDGARGGDNAPEVVAAGSEGAVLPLAGEAPVSPEGSAPTTPPTHASVDSASEPLFDPAPAMEPSARPAAAPESSTPMGGQPRAEKTTEPKTFEVVGSTNGERVTLETARTNPRYWVDPDTREVWDAALRKGITGEEESHKTA